MFTLAISCFDHFQFTLFHGPNIPGSYAILFFTASNFTFTTRYIHSWTLFLLQLSLFIPSGAISCSSPVAYWAPTDLGSPSFSVIFLPLSYCSWDFQGKNAEVVCHSFLQWTRFSQNSPPWFVYLGWPYMAHSFIELDKTVVHVISVVSFLWLWFSLLFSYLFG